MTIKLTSSLVTKVIPMHCPLCGTSAVIGFVPKGKGHNAGYKCRCSKFGCKQPKGAMMPTKAEAAQAWNMAIYQLREREDEIA